MSDQITVAHVQQYSTNVQHLSQQMGSRLGFAVTPSTATGKAAKPIEQIGSVAPRRRTRRHDDTPQMDTPHDARWVHPHDWEWADLVDSTDLLRMIIDPRSPYAEAAAMAMGRAKDEEIIAAFTAVAKTGEDGDVDASPLPGNTIDEDFDGADDSGLTFAKMREARRILMAANVDLTRDPVFIGVTAQQHDDLLDFTSNSANVLTSSDYVNQKPLESGLVGHYLGMTIIHSELFELSSEGFRQCPVWTKSGIVCCEWDGLKTRISERDDKSYSTQIFASQTLGATRTEEVKTVIIECVEP